MAQVMYDRAIMFSGRIYSVTQTWNGPNIVITVKPKNENLRTLLTTIIQRHGQIKLKCCSGYYEIMPPVN